MEDEGQSYLMQGPQLITPHEPEMLPREHTSLCNENRRNRSISLPDAFDRILQASKRGSSDLEVS